MRNNLTVSPVAASIEYVPEDYLAPLDFDLLFGRSAPVEIDLGCGDGSFITLLAQQRLGRNFLVSSDWLVVCAAPAGRGHEKI